MFGSCSVGCPIEDLADPSIELSGEEFTKKLKQAVDISRWIVTERRLTMSILTVLIPLFLLVVMTFGL